MSVYDADGNLLAVKDGSITKAKLSADLQTTVDDVSDLKSSLYGFNAATKSALLALLQKVAYVDTDGQELYDALEDALYPPLDVDYITAVYTQSGTVYDTDTLDSLKPDLVVTAYYSDGTSGVVTTYALSGTLAEGTSNITVSYGGKTTTFSVTVTSLIPDRYTWLYNARNGELLSAQSYVSKVTSGGDTSETLNNGILVAHADSNGTTSGTTSVLLRFNLTDATTTGATLTARAKLIDYPVALGTSGGSGQRFQLSNGTSGAQCFFVQNGEYITVVYFEGSTRKTAETSFLLSDYHIFEIALRNGHQYISIDGTLVVDSATLSTNYCTSNAILLQGVGTVLTPTGVTTNFDWITYYEEQ